MNIVKSVLAFVLVFLVVGFLLLVVMGLFNYLGSYLETLLGPHYGIYVFIAVVAALVVLAIFTKDKSLALLRQSGFTPTALLSVFVFRWGVELPNFDVARCNAGISPA